MTLLTEGEAAKRWCPFVRLPADHVGGGINRDTKGNTSRAYCIGSACMAWRTAETAEFKIKAEDAFRKYGTRLVSDTGFCGLAGRPS